MQQNIPAPHLLDDDHDEPASRSHLLVMADDFDPAMQCRVRQADQQWLQTHPQAIAFRHRVQAGETPFRYPGGVVVVVLKVDGYRRIRLFLDHRGCILGDQREGNPVDIQATSGRAPGGAGAGRIRHRLVTARYNATCRIRAGGREQLPVAAQQQARGAAIPLCLEYSLCPINQAFQGRSAGDAPYYAFHRLATRCRTHFSSTQPSDTHIQTLIDGVYARARRTTITQEWNRLAKDHHLRSAIRSLPDEERWLAQLELQILATEVQYERSSPWPRYALFCSVWITILLHSAVLVIYGWSWLPMEWNRWGILILGIHAGVWGFVWLYRLNLAYRLMRAYRTLNAHPVPNERQQA